MADLVCDCGNGEWGNVSEVVHMERNSEEQKKYVKQLWHEDSERYFEWNDAFPDFFHFIHFK